MAPAEFGKFIADETENVGQGGQVLRRQGGLIPISRKDVPYSRSANRHATTTRGASPVVFCNASIYGLKSRQRVRGGAVRPLVTCQLHPGSLPN
jgi:hypothetical protein